MTVCMSGAAWLSVLRVTIALNVLLLLTWGWHFEYPTVNILLSPPFLYFDDTAFSN
jgi:hypothetical protein